VRDVTASSAGNSHNAALTREGRVICWGNNTCGQCDVPSDLPTVIAIGCGDLFSLTVTNAGAVIVWGGISDGQCDVPEDLVVGGTVVLL
jgi:alpha-tubulin suppressor-like RCC1 family protein